MVAIRLVVLDVDTGKALADGANRFIRSQDAAA